MRYDNPHFRDVNNKMMNYYCKDAMTTYALNNVINPNLTGGSIRRQYEYVPPSFIQSKEAEGRKLIINGANVLTPSNYNYGNSGNMPVPMPVKGRNSKIMRGGDFWGDVGNFFKPVASAVLDIGAPALGAFVGGPAGATLAKGAREGLRATTGWGKGKRKMKEGKNGVGVYAGSLNASDTPVGGAMSAGCNGMPCVPCMKKEKKMKGSAKTAGAKTAGAKKGSRMDMVKKVMKEKKMNLGQASKYIKENNLY
jgi:hypothetical protein